MAVTTNSCQSTPYIRTAFLLFVSSLVLTVPYAFHISNAPHHDAMVFTIWMKEFSSQFFEGNLYPHWISGLENGLGRPDFYFYPPIVMWIANLFYWPAVIDNWHFFQIWATGTLLLFLSGVTCYYWISSRYGSKAALLLALLYMTNMNHFYLALSFRSAMAETANYAWLPLVILYTQNVWDYGRKYIPHLALSFALVMLTNIPTSLLIFPLPLIYGIFRSFQDKQSEAKSRFILLAIAYALALGLTAFYWPVVLSLKQYINLAALKQDDSYYYGLNFFRISTNDSLNSSMFVWNLVTAVFALGYSHEIRKGGEKQNYFWLTAVIVSFIMMIPSSALVWEYFKPLDYVQFPMRFGIIISAACLPVLAIAMRKRDISIIIKALIGLGIFAMIYSMVIPIFQFNSDEKSAHSLKPFQEKTTRMYNESMLLAPEYLPRWFETKGFTEPDVVNRMIRDTHDKFADSKFITQKGTVTIKVIDWHPERIVISYSAKEPSVIFLRHFYFPTWHATTNHGQEISLSPAAGDSLMTLEIPQGEGEISIQIRKTLTQKIGIMVSILFATIMIIMLVKQRKNNGKVAHETTA